MWLGVHAVCISSGYLYIGAAAGTFVFSASVLLTLVAGDLARRVPIAASRLIGAAVSLLGIGVLASGSSGTVSVRGMPLLAATGVAWGLYTAAGRTTADPRVATTGHFPLLATVILLPTVFGAASGLRVTGSGLAWAVAMGAGTTALAYVAWYVCQRSLSGAAAGSVQLVIPVITAIGAVVLLGEAVSLRLLLAAAMVLGGMWLGRAEPCKARPDPPAAHPL